MLLPSLNEQRELTVRASLEDWQDRLLVAPGEEGRPIPDWLAGAWREFRENLSDPAYPCFFGGQAFRANAIHHSFVETEGSAHLPQTLRRFLVGCRDHPLANFAVFFEPERNETHGGSCARFWATLRLLQESDSAAEPVKSIDPDTALWEFTFAGTQMFVVGISPTYRSRRSRNLGPCMIMLFQPRTVFEISGAGRDSGEAARSLIRERLGRWDTMPPHPALGVYGDPDNREWQQYFLPDDNVTPLGACPLPRATPTERDRKAARIRVQGTALPSGTRT